MWILLSLIGAFSQALGSAFKKKALQTPKMNNVIGFISFMFAGIVFLILFILDSGNSFGMNSHISLRFWQAMAWYAGLNVLAVWFMYRALDLAEFSHLMPYMTLTSLSLIIPPMIFLKEFPSLFGFGGIVLIVFGALLMNYKSMKSVKVTRSEKKQRSDNRRGVLYFLVTAACFTFAPTAAKITVQESSVLFASFVVHTLIALGFLMIMVGVRELPRLSSTFRDTGKRKFLAAVLLAGLIIVLENGSINAALGNTSVAYVFALKRTMPLFAFVIGYIYFHERTELHKKLIATVLMVIGAVITTLH